MAGSAPSLDGVATEAWLCLYPLVLMQLTRQVEPDLVLNRWSHAEGFRSPDFTAVVRPNVDTVYSHAWLNLSGGPVALTVPDTGNKYYVVQAMDQWSMTFATIGTRTTGNRPGTFVFGYTIRFASDRLPPVQAFCSLTVYNDAGYLVDNPISRYNLGTKDQPTRDPDGAITVVLAASAPTGDHNHANWLPIPAGPFTVSFRAYRPSESIGAGPEGWHLAPIERLT